MRAVIEITAADHSRETEEVLNQRGCSRLAARGIAFQDHSIESFRSSVHGCGQTGRPGANNRYIATDFFFLILGKRLKQTRHLCDFAQGRKAQWHSTRSDKCEQILGNKIQSLHEWFHVFARWFHASVRIVLLTEKIIELMSFA